MPGLRKDYVTDTWVVFSAARAHRPGAFKKEKLTTDPAKCPFCYGHEPMTPPEILAYRKDGQPNGPGWWIRRVPNKFPALPTHRDPDRAAPNHGGGERRQPILRVNGRRLHLLRDHRDGTRGGGADRLRERFVHFPLALRRPVPLRDVDPPEGPRDVLRGP